MNLTENEAKYARSYVPELACQFREQEMIMRIKLNGAGVQVKTLESLNSEFRILNFEFKPVVLKGRQLGCPPNKIQTTFLVLFYLKSSDMVNFYNVLSEYITLCRMI